MLLAEITRSILEKVRRSEKLSTEELMILMLGLNYRQVVEFKKEMLELYRQFDSGIEAVRREMQDSYKRLDGRIDDVGRRLDAIHQLLAGAEGLGGLPAWLPCSLPLPLSSTGGCMSV